MALLAELTVGLEMVGVADLRFHLQRLHLVESSPARAFAPFDVLGI